MIVVVHVGMAGNKRPEKGVALIPLAPQIRQEKKVDILHCSIMFGV